MVECKILCKSLGELITCVVNVRSGCVVARAIVLQSIFIIVNDHGSSYTCKYAGTLMPYTVL
jgi:hypothetical protein